MMEDRKDYRYRELSFSLVQKRILRNIILDSLRYDGLPLCHIVFQHLKLVFRNESYLYIDIRARCNFMELSDNTTEARF